MCDGKMCSCPVHKTTKVLLIIGGLNWGLIGLGMLFNMGSWDVVAMIFGTVPSLQAIVYVLVGIAAVMQIFRSKCKKCKEACAACEAKNMDKNM